MSVTLVEVKKMLKEMFLEYRKEMETMLKQQQQIFIDILSANTKIINERLDKVEENSKENANKIKIMVKDIEDIKLSLNFHDEVFDKKLATIHKQNNERVEKENITTQNINEKLRKFEDRSRRNNLRIDGLPESVKETWNETEEKVKLFLVNKLGLNEIEIERAHRNGVRKEGSSRTVIMKLLRYNDKTKILKESYRLKGTKTYINEDFSHETVNIRKRLLAEVKERRNNGENVGLSYISYCNVIWASTYPSKLNTIYKIQKRASRLILNANKYASARPLLRELGVPNVYEINILNILIFMFKFKNGMLPSIFQTYFFSLNHKYETKYSINNFFIPKTLLKQADFSISCRGPRLWNLVLTSNIKTLTSTQQFKRATKQHLFDFDTKQLLSFY
ncbi:uncharacterized protein LOC136075253 [Hydra vulgaris]|uniref:Uncharacterized protein LOC136075253 n=1 Tax=Hydra vulgaris TaxID=6087 RepID=A0ABM4B4W4_HYDVU